jgi:methionyl-tRNA synthetase
MAQKARELGTTPRELCDEMSAHFKAMCDTLNISYDKFQRTTDEAHYRASQAIWQAMADKGDLYLDRYEGWYSVRDEAFYDESELVTGDDGAKLSPQGTPVEWTVEKAGFSACRPMVTSFWRFIATIPNSSSPKAAATK